MRILLKRFFAVAVTAALTLSCKKDYTPTISQRLVGKWQEVQYATDDDNSGVLQGWELHPVNKSFTIFLNFKSDSTGYEAVTVADSTTQYTFTWWNLTNDSLQRNGEGHDTVVYDIVNITELSMTLKVMGSQGLVWYIYNKK